MNAEKAEKGFIDESLRVHNTLSSIMFDAWFAIEWKIAP